MKENIQEKEPEAVRLANQGTPYGVRAGSPGYSCLVGFDNYSGIVTNVSHLPFSKWTSLLQ